MPALRILRLARTRRLAIVGSGTRKARAISEVVSPASVLSVSATLASSASAGWQQVKIRRSRSSVTPLSSGASPPGSSGSVDTATSCSLSLPVALRLSLSIARLRAVVVSQAPGRDAVTRPGLQRPREGVLGALLGQVPVAGRPDQGRDDPSPLLAERVGDRRLYLRLHPSQIGLTSITPNSATGNFPASLEVLQRGVYMKLLLVQDTNLLIVVAALVVASGGKLGYAAASGRTRTV